MPLIDGTYELLDQRSTGDGRTLILATDPDGAPVRIVWYDVPAAAEATFEQYRRALKRLARDDATLLRDVVSRPGARFAVWDDPHEALIEPVDAAWRARLATLGIDPAAARTLQRGGTRLLASLDWTDEPRQAAVGIVRPGSDVPSRRPPRRAIGPAARSWALSTLLIVFAVLIAVTSWNRLYHDDLRTVPELAGLPIDQASARLASLGLSVEPQSLAGSGTPGTVLHSDPPSGTSIRPGRPVRLAYLALAAGTGRVTVPDLTGRPATAAGALLEPLDLTLGTLAYVPARLPRGTILGQQPGPRSTSEPGAAVHLVISDGPSEERTFLPDLTGIPVEDARDLARLAGLPADRILVDRVDVPGAPDGRVVAMTPLPWHRVSMDDVTVRLLVSDPQGAPMYDPLVPPEPIRILTGDPATMNTNEPAGPATGVPAPDVIGLSLDEARSLLEAAGRPFTVRYLAAADLPAGVVLQTPSPGERVEGSLELAVNAEALPVPRPQPVATIIAERLRWVPYAFEVPEPSGSAPTRVVVLATTVDGVVQEVVRTTVEAATSISGRWPTIVPGAVHFELRLDGVPTRSERVTIDFDAP